METPSAYFRRGPMVVLGIRFVDVTLAVNETWPLLLSSIRRACTFTSPTACAAPGPVRLVVTAVSVNSPPSSTFPPFSVRPLGRKITNGTPTKCSVAPDTSVGSAGFNSRNERECLLLTFLYKEQQSFCKMR